MNKLSSEQRYQLCKWLETNWGDLKELNRNAIVLKAVEYFGVDITRDNVDGALKIVGLQVADPVSKLWTYVREIENRLIELESFFYQNCDYIKLKRRNTTMKKKKYIELCHRCGHLQVMAENCPYDLCKNCWRTIKELETTRCNVPLESKKNGEGC